MRLLSVHKVVISGRRFLSAWRAGTKTKPPNAFNPLSESEPARRSTTAASAVPTINNYDKRLDLLLFQTDQMEVAPARERPTVGMVDKLNQYRIFRTMAPYIAVHYGATMVIHVPGEVLESNQLESVMHDIVLLKTLGMKPVVVSGCKIQLRRRLQEVGKESIFVNGVRVSDLETLQHCESVAGQIRIHMESLLTRGLMNSPTGVGSVNVVSGNFVRANAFGVRDGVDFLHTGVVARVDEHRVRKYLDQGDLVLLSNIGISPGGTVYQCRSEDVAVRAAIDLKASKLIFLHNGECLLDKRKEGGAVVDHLNVKVARHFCKQLAEEIGQDATERISDSDFDSELQWELQFLDYFQGAVTAVQNGVNRAHLIDRNIEGGIISELCTRDGSGILISQDLYEGVRTATVPDVPAIKKLILPLEDKKILITRPPKTIELDIANFVVFERDGSILACCHYRSFPDERYGVGAVEMSCVVVSPSIRATGIGNALLSYCLRRALAEGYHHVFVLTTQSQGWFIDRGFQEVPPQRLPPQKLSSYDYTRNSKVLFKFVENERAVDEEEMIWYKPANKKT